MKNINSVITTVLFSMFLFSCGESPQKANTTNNKAAKKQTTTTSKAVVQAQRDIFGYTGYIYDTCGEVLYFSYHFGGDDGYITSVPLETKTKLIQNGQNVLNVNLCEKLPGGDYMYVKPRKILRGFSLPNIRTHHIIRWRNLSVWNKR